MLVKPKPFTYHMGFVSLSQLRQPICRHVESPCTHITSTIVADIQITSPSHHLHLFQGYQTPCLTHPTSVKRITKHSCRTCASKLSTSPSIRHFTKRLLIQIRVCHSAELSDVRLTYKHRGGGMLETTAHKVILAAGSGFFRRQFQQPNSEERHSKSCDILSTTSCH